MMYSIKRKKIRSNKKKKSGFDEVKNQTTLHLKEEKYAPQRNKLFEEKHHVQNANTFIAMRKYILFHIV